MELVSGYSLLHQGRAYGRYGGGRDARGGKSSFVGRRTEARGDERLRISWRSEARAGKGLMHGGYRRREGLVTCAQLVGGHPVSQY